MRAKKLHQASSHSDIKTFWKSVKTDCAPVIVADSI